MYLQNDISGGGNRGVDGAWNDKDKPRALPLFTPNFGKPGDWMVVKDVRCD